MTMRAGAPLLFGTGIGRGVSRCAPTKPLVTDLPRSSGIQLHPTSLHGGRLGREAYAWVDWLADAGQQWWQMLPLGPPDRHRSPPKAAAAFAARPRLLGGPGAPGPQEGGPGLPQ